MRPRALLILALAFVLAAAGCTREEKRSEQQSPIARVTLPPQPLKSPREEPKLAKAAPPTAAAPAVSAAVSTEATPRAERPGPAVAAAPTAPLLAPAGVAPTASAAPKAGVVGKGVDLRSEPALTARIRGTFEGRTAVEVLAEKEGWSLVRAPIVTGGFVEGWVLSPSVRPPGEVETAKAPSAAKAPAAKAAARPPGAGAAKAPAGGEAPAKGAPEAVAKAPAAKPARAQGGGSKGPDKILLKPIPGTAGKQPATPFTHKAHYDDYNVSCVGCHHKVKALGGTEPATKTCTDAGCHTATQCNNQTVPKKNAACPFFEDAYHMNCIGCHREQSGPTKCKECHTG